MCSLQTVPKVSVCLIAIIKHYSFEYSTTEDMKNKQYHWCDMHVTVSRYEQLFQRIPRN